MSVDNCKRQYLFESATTLDRYQRPLLETVKRGDAGGWHQRWRHSNSNGPVNVDALNARVRAPVTTFALNGRVRLPSDGMRSAVVALVAHRTW